jgi:hypothetical protein
VLLAPASEAIAQSGIIAWGDNSDSQCSPLPSLPAGENCVQVSAGGVFSVARGNGGSLVAWGDNILGQCNIPVLPSGVEYIDVACGFFHTVAILSDGSAVAWGRNDIGQCNVPALGGGLTFTLVTVGIVHAVAAVSDGTLLAWGNNSQGQCNVPTLPPGLSVVQLSAGGVHTLALLSDGTVIAWGRNLEGQCEVPPLPTDLTYVKVAAGQVHSVALRSDGRIVAWGGNLAGECTVPPPPHGLSYIGVTAGGRSWYSANLGFTVGLLSDGRAVAWGHNFWGQCDVPVLKEGDVYVEIKSGGAHTIARTAQTRIPFCFGDGSGTAACPCGNNGWALHGCENSVATGGAVLSSTGTSSLSADTFVMYSSGESPTALSIFIQGDDEISAAVFGDGLRCVGGHLKRLYTKNASGGVVIAPFDGDPSVSARSTAIGDTIPGLGTRVYQVYYRDPDLSFCPSPTGSTFNISSGLRVTWYP